jgi:hypothetical protein
MDPDKLFKKYGHNIQKRQDYALKYIYENIFNKCEWRKLNEIKEEDIDKDKLVFEREEKVEYDTEQPNEFKTSSLLFCFDKKLIEDFI